MPCLREYGFASNSEESIWTQSNLSAEAVSRACPENLTVHCSRAVWPQASIAQDDSKYYVCVFEYTH